MSPSGADPDEVAAAPPGDDQEHEDDSAHRKGMSYAVMSFTVNGAIGLVGAIITSRIYGVDAMGQYALVVAPWLILIQLSSVAERVALVRELAGLPRRSPRVTGLFIPILAFSALLTFVVAIPLMIISALVFHGPANQPDLVLPALAVVVAYVLFDNTSLNIDGVFAAFRSGRDLFIGRFLQLGGFPIFAILLAPWRKDITALTLATVLSMVLALFVRLFLVRSFLALKATSAAVRQGVKDLPDMLRFGLRVLPAQLSAGLADQASTWVLSVLLPISAVGGWSRASGLAGRMTEAGWRVSEILFPTLVQRHRAGDTNGFAEVLSKTIRMSGIVILLPAAVGAGAAAGILNIFGPGFSDVSGAFAILLFGYALGVAAMGIGQALMAAGRPHLLSVIGVTRAVVGVVLLIPGAIIGGTIGAALALLIAILTEAALGSMYVIRLVGRSSLPSFRHILGVSFASALAFAASRVIDTHTTTFPGTLVAMAAGTVVYVVAVVPTATESDERATAWAKVRSFRRGGGGDAPGEDRAADEAPVAGH